MPRKNDKLVLVVDVETCGGFGAPHVYDLGFAVVEPKTGNIVESHSLVIPEVFYGMADEMANAYYAEKLPQYVAGIEAGTWQVVPFWTAWNLVHNTMRKYGIRKVYAYNCGFDRNALNSTMQAMTCGKWKHFFPRNTIFCDIWHMACQTIMSQRNFIKFCNRNGHVSDAGNVRTTAEVCYAYMTKNPHFEESHTGLEDVVIEAQILAKIIKIRRGIVDESLVAMPWQIPQVVRVQMENEKQGSLF